MLVEREHLTIPRDRKHRVVPQSRKARESVTDKAQLRLNQIALPIGLECDPCMPNSVATVFSEDETSIIAHDEELTPCPQREVFAITFFRLLKVFWRLPILFFAEQFLVGNSSARGKKFADVRDRSALNRERMAQVTPNRFRGS